MKYQTYITRSPHSSLIPSKHHLTSNNITQTQSYTSLTNQQTKDSFSQHTILPHPFIKKENTRTISNQIELMNIKLSFELLRHKLTQFNSIILPNDYQLKDHKQFHINDPLLPLNSTMSSSYQSHPNELNNYNANISSSKLIINRQYEQMKKNRLRKSNNGGSMYSSIDLSEIADDLVDVIEMNNRNNNTGMTMSNQTSLNYKTIDCSNDKKGIRQRFQNEVELTISSFDKEKEKERVRYKEECVQVDMKEESGGIGKYDEEKLKIDNSQMINVIMNDNKEEIKDKVRAEKMDEYPNQLDKKKKDGCMVDSVEERKKGKNDDQSIFNDIKKHIEEGIDGSDDNEQNDSMMKRKFRHITNFCEEEEQEELEEDQEEEQEEDEQEEKECINDDNEEQEEECEIDEEEQEEDEFNEEQKNNYHTSNTNSLNKLHDHNQFSSPLSIQYKQTTITKSPDNNKSSPIIIGKSNLLSNISNDDEEEEEKNSEPKIESNDDDGEYEDIFNSIIEKAKQNNSLINNNTTPQKTSSVIPNSMTTTSKQKRSVTFSDQKKIIISYNLKDPITKLSIYDSLGKKRLFTPSKPENNPNDIKTPIKLRSIIMPAHNDNNPNGSTQLTPNTINEKKIALDKLTSLLNESDKEYDKTPMQKNINIIKEISDLHKQGKTYPIPKPHRQIIPKPYVHCKKFSDNPQKFFSEDLCASVLKALRLRTKTKSSSLKKDEKIIKRTIPIEEDKNCPHKKTNDSGNIMYNIKKYFEDEKIEQEESDNDHFIDVDGNNLIRKLSE